MKFTFSNDERFRVNPIPPWQQIREATAAREAQVLAGLMAAFLRRSNVMTIVRLESSNLKSVSYSLVTTKLVVHFHSDTVYEYGRVPLAMFLGLIRAVSAGVFFAAHIRNKYPFSKLK